MLYKSQLDFFIHDLKDLSVKALPSSDFRSATATMSSTSTPTLSCVHGVFKALQDALSMQLTNFASEAPSSCKNGLKNAYDKLGDYFYRLDESPYYIWASSKSTYISKMRF